MSDAATVNFREMSLPLRGSSAPPQRRATPPAYFPDRAEELYEIGALLTTNLDASILLEDTYHWRRWVPAESDPLLWTKRASIRHANQIELSSLRLIVPEDLPVLQVFLQVCFPDMLETDAAKKLLALLTDDNLTFSTSLTLESRLGSRPNDSMCNARVMTFFRSSFRPTDWQIVRQLAILFCSKESAECLAHIAGADISGIPWSTRDRLGTECIVEAINKLNFVSGMQSAGLALGRLALCLKASPKPSRECGYAWARYGPQIEGAISADLLSLVIARLVSETDTDISDLVVPYVQKQCLSYIIQAEQSTDKKLCRPLGLPEFSTGGILIKKHEGWPDEVPEFCFLVVDETADFDEERHLAKLLDMTQRRKERFGVDKKGARFSLHDKDLIDRWVQILARPLLPDIPQEL